MQADPVAPATGQTTIGEEVARVLRHVIHRIRRHWPQVAILVRTDGYRCALEALDLLPEKCCDYVLGLAQDKTLDALAEPWREQCRWRWAPSLGKVHRFHQLQYAAETWTREENGLADKRLGQEGIFARRAADLAPSVITIS